MELQEIGTSRQQTSSEMETRRAEWGLRIGGAVLVMVLLALAGGLLYQHHVAAATAPAPSALVAQGPRGRITAISATSITISSRRSGTHTFTLTPTTLVTLDGKPATAQAMTIGIGARVTAPDGTTATQVALRTRRARAGGWVPGGTHA